MKRYKVLTALLIALLTVILAACGNSNNDTDTPNGFNPDAYASGKQAVRIIEDYEAGEITINEAFEQFAPLIDYLDTIEPAEDEKETTTQIIGYVNALAYDLTYTIDYEEDLTGLIDLLGV